MLKTIIYYKLELQGAPSVLVFNPHVEQLFILNVGQLGLEPKTS